MFSPAQPSEAQVVMKWLEMKLDTEKLLKDFLRHTSHKKIDIKSNKFYKGLSPKSDEPLFQYGAILTLYFK